MAKRIQIRTDNYYDLFPEERLYHAANPIAWYTELFGGESFHFRWSELPEYKDHRWHGTVDPLATALECIARGQWVAIEAATSVGKTYTESVAALWYLSTRKNSTVTCIGNSSRDLMDTLFAEIRDKFTKFQTLVPTAELHETGRIFCDRGDMKSSKWFLSMRAAQVKADQKSAGVGQGKHNEYMLFILDECAKIHPSVVTSVDNTCTDRRHNIVWAAGNPDSHIDALHQFSKLPYVKHIRISAEDFPDVVCNRKVIGGGAVTRQSIEDRRKAFGEKSTIFQSRVHGISSADTKDSMFNLSTMLSLRRDHVVYDIYTGSAAGVDVANSPEGDKGSVTYMQGDTFVWTKNFNCPNANAVATNMMFSGDELDRRLLFNKDGARRLEDLPNYGLKPMSEFGVTAREVCVDDNGVGVGTVNEFKFEEYYVYPFKPKGTVMKNEGLINLLPYDKQTGKFVMSIENVRSLAIMLLKWDIENGDIFFGPGIATEQIEHLHLELAAHHIVPGTKMLRISSKEDVAKKLVTGKSPNDADSFAYANFIRRLHILGLVEDSFDGGVFQDGYYGVEF